MLFKYSYVYTYVDRLLVEFHSYMDHIKISIIDSSENLFKLADGTGLTGNGFGQFRAFLAPLERKFLYTRVKQSGFSWRASTSPRRLSAGGKASKELMRVHPRE